MQIFLTIATFFLFVVFPGYFIVRLIISGINLSLIDKLIFSVMVGVFLNLFFFALFNTIGLKIEKQSLLPAFMVTGLFSFLIKKPIIKKIKFSFKRENLLLLLSLLITIILRIPPFLSHPLPHTTDLSNHIFYAKYIIENGILPEYSHPQFVLTEHVILSLSPILMHTNILGVSTYVTLYIINALIGLVIFRIIFYTTSSFFSGLIGLMISSNFFLYTSFNLTYVEGGVVGNILSNFLIPTFILLVILFFDKKYYRLLPLIVTNLTLIINSHTLSTVILFWVTFLSLSCYAIFNFPSLKKTIGEIFSPKKRKWLLISFIPLLIFIFYVPDYFTDKRATSLIDPSLASKQTVKNFFTGIFGNRYLNIIPPSLYLVATAGLVIFFLSQKKDNFPKYLFLFWLIVPLVYTILPGVFLIHLPAHRTINYLFSPIVIAVSLFTQSLAKKEKTIIFFSLLILSLIVNFDNSLYEIKNIENNKKIMEKSEEGFLFLANIIKPGENVLTEHISPGFADQAIKNYLEFSNRVFYRTFLFRYENGDMPWDTWKMMENPVDNLNLYVENNIKYIVVPNTDLYKNKFQETNIASNIFENDTLVIFEMK